MKHLTSALVLAAVLSAGLFSTGPALAFNANLDAVAPSLNFPKSTTKPVAQPVTRDVREVGK